MRRWWQRILPILCEHDWRWLRNLYGDAIEEYGGARSVWRCHRCGKFDYRGELHGIQLDVEAFARMEHGLGD